MRRVWILGVVGLLGAALPIGAADLEWGGVLELIVEDDGSGKYTGGVEGTSPFSGLFVYPPTCGAGCIIEPFPPDAVNYVFPGGTGVIEGLGACSFGVESSVEINDDEVVDQDAVDLAAEFGLTLTLGQTIDAWSVASETAGEFTPQFVEWEVAYIYSTTDPFSNNDYTPTPPPDPDLILFEIDENQELAYFAFGEVTSIPEPAATLGLASGLLALAALQRRRRSQG